MCAYVCREAGHDATKFKTRLLNMCLRYHCIMGETGQHGQLPKTVFQFLHRELEVLVWRKWPHSLPLSGRFC